MPAGGEWGSWSSPKLRPHPASGALGGSPNFDLIRVRFAHPPSPPQGKACRKRAVSAAGEGDRSMPLFPLLVSRCGRRKCTGEVPEPSPMQGKVAKAIFCENCFRRMRWNIGVLLRYTKAYLYADLQSGLPVSRSRSGRCSARRKRRKRRSSMT